MRTYGMNSLTAFVASSLAAETSERDMIELLRNHSDPAELAALLRRNAVLLLGSDTNGLAEAALASVDYDAIAVDLLSLVHVKVELPCHHESVELASFGGWDARHGADEATEAFEHCCGTCRHTWQIALHSVARDERSLQREFVFTLAPERAVYRQSCSFNSGSRLTSSSGMWDEFAASAPRSTLL
jgi:hypothetical protein